jgi:hypothetical protein
MAEDGAQNLSRFLPNSPSSLATNPAVQTPEEAIPMVQGQRLHDALTEEIGPSKSRRSSCPKIIEVSGRDPVRPRAAGRELAARYAPKSARQRAPCEPGATWAGNAWPGPSGRHGGSVQAQTGSQSPSGACAHGSHPPEHFRSGEAAPSRHHSEDNSPGPTRGRPVRECWHRPVFSAMSRMPAIRSPQESTTASPRWDACGARPGLAVGNRPKGTTP